MSHACLCLDYLFPDSPLCLDYLFPDSPLFLFVKGENLPLWVGKRKRHFRIMEEYMG